MADVTTAVSPLRRMIDDMTFRNLSPATQRFRNALASLKARTAPPPMPQACAPRKRSA